MHEPGLQDRFRKEKGRGLLHETEQVLELRRAGFAQPLEHDHLAVNDIDPGPLHAGERKPTARLGARGDRVGDYEGFEALILKIDCRLGDADMGFDAAHHHLSPAPAAEFMQVVSQGIVLQARELDFLDDRSVIAKSFAQGRDGRADSAKVVSDPGYGFGQAARQCALETRFIPARDRDGKPVAGETRPFNFRFTRP